MNSLPDRIRQAYLNPANQSIVDEITAMGSVWRPESDLVRVLNMWENYTLHAATGEYEFSGDRSSKFIRVPAPGAAGLAVLGLSVIGLLNWRARRRSKSSQCELLRQGIGRRDVSHS